MSHRTVRSLRARISMLKIYRRLWRSHGASFRAVQMERKLHEAQAALLAAEDKVRGGTMRMFDVEAVRSAPGEACTYLDGPTGVEVVLIALDAPGQFRLTFRHLAAGHDVSLQCRGEDVNTLAELIVRGEQALFEGDQTVVRQTRLETRQRFTTQRSSA